MKRYRAFDLVVDSHFDLPGAVEIDRTPDAADIVIATGDAMLVHATASLGPYRMIDDRIEFTAVGVGRYLIEAGRRITVEAERPGDPTMLIALLIATALPAALWARGDMALHCCAVVPQGASAAIAVTAPSGGGKSTVLAAWAAAGASAIADDVVRLVAGDVQVVASGLPGGCFRQVTGPDDRAFLSFPAVQQLARAPLAALVRLDFATGPARLERLDAVAAIELLLAARHRPKVPTLLGKSAALLKTCGLLARNVAMYRLTIERGGAHNIVDRLSGLATADMMER